MNKNAVYVLKQPGHVILSLVVIGMDHPKSTKFLETIDELSSVSDVLFIFSDRVGIGDIDLRKFSSLYGACGFIHGTKEIGETLFQVLEYSKHIFQRHVGYVVMNDWNIPEIEDVPKLCEQLQTWTMSTITSPIFQIRRLDPTELYRLYRLPKKPWWKIQPEEDNIGMYMTHTSPSPVLFFKNLIRDKWLEEDRENYLKTFTENDVRSVLASLVKDLGINYLEKADVQADGSK